MTPPSDDSLLQAWNAGGPGAEAAFRQLESRYTRRFFGIAGDLLRSRRNEVPDAVQQIWLEITRCRHTIREGVPFEPWAIRVAENICTDIHKKKRAKPGLPAAEPVAAGSGPATQVRDRDLRERLNERLHALIEQLPDAQRTVVRERRFGGLQVQEIAARLGVSTETVRRCWAQALETIGATLRKEFPEAA